MSRKRMLGFMRSVAHDRPRAMGILADLVSLDRRIARRRERAYPPLRAMALLRVLGIEGPKLERLVDGSLGGEVWMLAACCWAVEHHRLRADKLQDAAAGRAVAFDLGPMMPELEEALGRRPADIH